MKNIKYVICLTTLVLLTISCNNKNITDPTNSGIPTIPPPELEVTVPWDGTTSTKPDIENNAYSIKTAKNLAWLGAQTTAINKNITFVSNVDMNNYHFDGIAEYQGTIDGNNKTIKNIMMDGSTDNAGLINTANGNTTIKDLGIEGGSIKGKNRAGGLIAYVDAGLTVTIENSYNTADISAATTSGGLIGYTDASTVTIENSYNTADISATTYCAGLVGYANLNSTVTMEKSYNTGNISTAYTYSSSGGLIGYIDASTVTIENSYNLGDISSPSSSAFPATSPPEPSLPPLSSSGGLIAFADNFSSIIIIKTSFSYGSIEGVTRGGIIGYGTTSRESLNNYWYSSSQGTINTIGGTKFSVEQFKQSSNFDGWYFRTVWNAPETSGKNYPTLK